MNNFYSRGDRVTFTNSGSAITSGSVVVLTSGNSGGIGVAVTDIAASTGVGEVAVCGVHTLTALSTDTGTAETVVYWDASNSRITTTSTSNTLAGKLAAAKTNGQTTAKVLVNSRIHP